MTTESCNNAPIGQAKPLVSASRLHGACVVRSVALPPANPAQFRAQLVNGACSPIIDWYAFRAVVICLRSGKQVNISAELASAPGSVVKRSFKNKFAYILRLSDQASVHVSIGPFGYVHIAGNPMSLHRRGNEFRTREPAQDCAAYTRAVHQAFCLLHGGPVQFVGHSLTRIDLTQMLDCGNAAIASATHRSLHIHARAKHPNGVNRKVNSYENSVTFSANSKYAAIKLYRVSEKLKPKISFQDDRWIRVEVCLRGPELARLVRENNWAPQDLNRIFHKYTSQLRGFLHQWKPDRSKHPPQSLSPDLRIYWYAWVAGVDLRTLPQCRKNFGRLVRRFALHGIDISVAPTPRRIKALYKNALTLPELLDPSRYDADGHTFRKDSVLNAVILASGKAF